MRRELAQVVSGGKCSPYNNKKGLGSVGGDLLRQPWLCGGAWQKKRLFQNTESCSSVNTSRVSPSFVQKANLHVRPSKPTIQSALFPFQLLRNALRGQSLQNTTLQPQQYVASSRLVSPTNSSAFFPPRNGCKATFTSSPVHTDQDRPEDPGAADETTLDKRGKLLCRLIGGFPRTRFNVL